MNSVRKYMVALCSLAIVPMMGASQPAGEPVKQEQASEYKSGEYRSTERPAKQETNERERRGIVGRTWDGARDMAHSAWRSVKSIFGY